MKEVGIKFGVYVYIFLIVYFFKENQIDKVLEICKEMEEERCEFMVVMYMVMICGYMSVGKAKEVWRVFNDMKEKGVLLDFKMYSKFVNCLC